MRRPRHCLVRQDSSISAMFSQDPCFGVWWISNPAGQCVRRRRRERLVQGGDVVGVQVVHDQHDLVRVGVVDVQQVLDPAGPVQAGAGRFRVGAAPAGQGLGPHEDRARPVAHVFGILTGHPSRRGRGAWAGVGQQLQRFLIHHDNRMSRIVRAGVHAEHVFHRGHERGVLLGRDRPARLQVRLKCPLFSTRPMVE